MTPRSPFRLLPCALAALLLAACGGGDGDSPPAPDPTPAPTPQPADPLAEYRAQQLAWAPCDPTILGYHSEDLDDLGERVSCAMVRVPLDYEQPTRGDAKVAVLRVAAAQPEQRRGTLFFNPGGPGVDGLGLPVTMGALWSLGEPSSETGHLLLRLGNEYDLIGFSPRGTGASTRLSCATNELKRRTDTSPHGRTPENIEDMLYNARKTAEACWKNPVTSYVSTEHTARDMDLVRELLDEDTLSYLGYSYGTWLGAWYGSRFAQHLDRAVLDSNMNFVASMERAELEQARSFQRVLDEVLAPYAARHAATFNLGRSADEVRAVFPALSGEIQTVAAESITQLLYRRDDADDALTQLGAARGLDAVLKAHPDANQTVVRTALQQYVFVPGSTRSDQRQRSIAYRLYDEVLKDEPASIALDGSDATYVAVMCNDTPTNGDHQFWIDAGNRQSQAYPLIGGAMTENVCQYWGGARVAKPGIAPLAEKDILMVQSQYDGATDTEGALEAFAALPQARLVYVAGEHQHGIFPYGDTCVDATVARHLLGETPAARETQCQSLPLPLDESASANARTTRMAPSAVEATPTYTDPARAAELIERIRDSIRFGPSR